MPEHSASQRLSRLRGGPVHALNGDIGTIVDFYFDDDDGHKRRRHKHRRYKKKHDYDD